MNKAAALCRLSKAGIHVCESLLLCNSHRLTGENSGLSKRRKNEKTKTDFAKRCEKEETLPDESFLKRRFHV